jgi:hypothetical protein
VDEHLRSHGTTRSPYAEIFIDEAWPPELVALMHRIEQKEDQFMSDAQDVINAAEAAFQTLVDQASATAADLAVVATKLSQWIAAQPETVDTSGLATLTTEVTAAASQLVTAQGGVDALLNDEPVTTADGQPAVAAGSAADASGAGGSVNTDPTASPTPAAVDVTDPASPADSAAPAPVIATAAPADTTPATAPAAS